LPDSAELTLDAGQCIIQMPDVAGLRLSAAQLPRNGGPELRNPSADRFVRHIDTALQKHLFHLTKAEIEPAIEPDRVGDYFRRKTMAFVADRWCAHL